MTPRTVLLSIILAAGLGRTQVLYRVADSLPAMLSVDGRPVRAELIVVFGGGGGRRLAVAAALAESGYSRRILVLGTNDEQDCASSILDEWSRLWNVNVLQAGRDLPDTLSCVRFLCGYVKDKGIKSVIVVTDRWHSRRVSMLMERYRESPSVQVTFTAPAAGAGPWWKDAAMSRNLAAECVKLVTYGIITLV